MRVLKIHHRRLFALICAVFVCISPLALKFALNRSELTRAAYVPHLNDSGAVNSVQQLELQLENGKWRSQQADTHFLQSGVDNSNEKPNYSQPSASFSDTKVSLSSSKDVFDYDNAIKYSHGSSMDRCSHYVPVGVIFTKAASNSVMQRNLARMLTTIAANSPSSCVCVHFFVDAASIGAVRQTFSRATAKYVDRFTLQLHNITEMAKSSRHLITVLQRYFSPRAGTYYNDVLFFLTVTMHLTLPQLARLIMVDIDVSVRGDIRQLERIFDEFTPTQVMGLSRELSPVYRHVLREYRRLHPNTTAGSPPPLGFPGLNSGVVLLHLTRMRRSPVYNRLLTEREISARARRYSFKGHLGDQDFYSLLALDNAELFHVLPCSWNRQLCRFWNNALYADVFDSYFECEARPVMLYHGNCRTELPTT